MIGKVLYLLEIDTASAFSVLETRGVSEISLNDYPWLTVVCILKDLDSGLRPRTMTKRELLAVALVAKTPHRAPPDFVSSCHYELLGRNGLPNRPVGSFVA